jgi:hypothetical protein
MPRARNIKPGLFKNEILGTADPNLTLLFISLWCLADREGRLEDRPERIKAETFPYRPSIDIEGSLNELQRKEFIIRYKVGNLKVIQVKEFCKHQSPHHTEKKSVLPPCDSNSLILNADGEITVNKPLDLREIPVVKRSDSLIPDSLIPDTGYLIPEKAPTKKKTPTKKEDRNFEFFWTIFPKRPDANKTKAARAWQARLNEGVSPEELLQGADRYRVYCEAENKEPQFILAGSTFLGPDLHYKLPWTSNGSNKADAFDSWLTGKKRGNDDVIDI